MLMQDYLLFKEENTDITIKDVPAGLADSGSIRYYGLRELNDAEIVKVMLTAESEGFDAVAGACYFDSGIKTASSLLSIPVVGAAQSAMHLAGMMGNKFAVITSESAWVMEMEHHLLQEGFGRHAVAHKPVRSLTLDMESLCGCLASGDPQPIIDDFCKVAESCLEDGADVLIAGCGLISPLFTLNGVKVISGAPIVDPMISSLKMTEMMVRLSAASMPVKSNRGLFQLPTDEIKRKELANMNIKI